jgi:hypothetical protein
VGRGVGGDGGPFRDAGWAKMREKAHKTLISRRNVTNSTCNFLEISRTTQSSMANPNPMEKSMDSVLVVANAGGGVAVAVYIVRRAIVSEAILQYFNTTRAITIETDALDYAISAIYSQLDNANILYPLGYFSRKLKSAELNYNIHDKELLAIVDALDKWSIYCKSILHMIMILFDHKNLKYWQTKQDLNLRQAHWGKRLANYNFAITYQPGKLVGKLDILSRQSGDSHWEGEMKY